MSDELDVAGGKLSRLGADARYRRFAPMCEVSLPLFDRRQFFVRLRCAAFDFRLPTLPRFGKLRFLVGKA
ncbi:MAG: hypothetical protein ACREQ5_05770, partial [Candidatus Dormibacteria bacterium]